MAQAPKKGTFSLLTTDAGTKQIRGVGFQGKALVLWCGRAAADATWSAHSTVSMGFADADGEQAGITVMDEDVLTASNTAKGRNTTFLLKGFSDGAPTEDFRLTFSAWDADGFDLNVSDAPSQTIIVHYLVFDLDDAEVFQFDTVTGANYPLDVTVEAGLGQPDLLIFMAAPANAVLGDDVDANLMLGVAKSDTERFAAAYHHNDGETSMDTGSLFAARALMIFRDTTSPQLEQELDLAPRAQWPTDGFRLAFIGGTGTHSGYTIFGLALYGVPSSKVEVFNSPTADGNQDRDAGFPPQLALFLTDDLPAHAGVDNSHVDGHGLGLGAFDGTDQGLIDFQQDDANSVSVAKNISDAANVIRLTGPGSPPANRGVGQASYPSGNTVRLSWTSLSATARQLGALYLGGFVTGGPTYDDAPSGGIVLGGAAPSELVHADSPAGGLALAGAAASAVVHASAPSGGIILDGAASSDTFRGYTDTPSGGIALTGAASSDLTHIHNPAGGVTLAGAVASDSTGTAAPSGGLSLAGAATSALSTDLALAGGIVLDGAASSTLDTEGAYDDFPTGGIQLGGTATSEHSTSYAPSGGLTLGGQAASERSLASAPVGGLVLAGSAVSEIATAVTAAGGIRLAGAAVSARELSVAPSGGIVLDGVVTLPTLAKAPAHAQIVLVRADGRLLVLRASAALAIIEEEARIHA